MTKEQFALLKIMEECAEIQHLCSKSIRFGLDSTNNGKIDRTNFQRLNEEIKNLNVAILNFENETNRKLEIITPEETNDMLNKIYKYMDYSKELGRLI